MLPHDVAYEGLEYFAFHLDHPPCTGEVGQVLPPECFDGLGWLALSPWLFHLHPETLSPTGRTLTLMACRRPMRVRGRCVTTWRRPLSASLLTAGRARKATSPTGAACRTRRSAHGCLVPSGRPPGSCSVSSTSPKHHCGRGRSPRRQTAGRLEATTNSRRWTTSGGNCRCWFALVSMAKNGGIPRKEGV